MSKPPKSTGNLHDRLRLRALAARDAMRDDLRAGWARTPTWLRVVGGVWIALSVALIVFLVVFDWNWARGPIGKIASAHGKSPSQVTLRWHVERGDIVFPKTTRRERMRENFEIFDFSLTADEVAAISALDRGEDGRRGPNPDAFDWIPD